MAPSVFRLLLRCVGSAFPPSLALLAHLTANGLLAPTPIPYGIGTLRSDSAPILRPHTSQALVVATAGRPSAPSPQAATARDLERLGKFVYRDGILPKESAHCSIWQVNRTKQFMLRRSKHAHVAHLLSHTALHYLQLRPPRSWDSYVDGESLRVLPCGGQVKGADEVRAERSAVSLEPASSLDDINVVPSTAGNDTSIAIDVPTRGGNAAAIAQLQQQEETNLSRSSIHAEPHVFHAECADQWFTLHATCPVCRASILTPQRESWPQPQQQGQRPDMMSDRDVP